MTESTYDLIKRYRDLWVVEDYASIIKTFFDDAVYKDPMYGLFKLENPLMTILQ